MNLHTSENTQTKWNSIFETIYNDYYRGLCVFAYSFLPDEDEAEEVVQSIILKLWEHKEQLHEIDSLKSYLYRSVRNACLNQLKHKKIEEKYKDKAWASLKEIEADFIDPYQNKELQEKIQDAINELPDRCKEVFELSRFEGKRNKEISEILDISVKAVEANITRALSSLRKELSKYIDIGM